MSNTNYVAISTVNWTGKRGEHHVDTSYIEVKERSRLNIVTGYNGQYSQAYPVALFVLGF